MTVDPINTKNEPFPKYFGTNDDLLILLNKTSQILCKWFSEAEQLGPFPIDNNFKCTIPNELGNTPEVLLSEIESLLYNSFNPVHPGSLAHLDPPPLIVSILGDLVAAGFSEDESASVLGKVEDYFKSNN